MLVQIHFSNMPVIYCRRFRCWPIYLDSLLNSMSQPKPLWIRKSHKNFCKPNFQLGVTRNLSFYCQLSRELLIGCLEYWEYIAWITEYVSWLISSLQTGFGQLMSSQDEVTNLLSTDIGCRCCSDILRPQSLRWDAPAIGSTLPNLSILNDYTWWIQCWSQVRNLLFWLLLSGMDREAAIEYSACIRRRRAKIQKSYQLRTIEYAGGLILVM